MPPRKQKQKQKQSQRQVVNINLGKSTGKTKRKYTRRSQTKVIVQQPNYIFNPQPYQQTLTPQVFIRPPTQELEIPSLGSQQPKKPNTVGEIKMDIPVPPKPELKQYTEPSLSEYTKPAQKPPANIINQPPRLSGLQEAITAQRERMRKVQTESRQPMQNVLEAQLGQTKSNLKSTPRNIDEIYREQQQREDVFGRQIAERKPFISPIAIASPIKRGRPSKGKQLPQYKERELMTMEDR